MSDDETKPKSIAELKEAALKVVVENNPLLAYVQHFKGREAEYSYGDFLRDMQARVSVKSPHQQAEVTAPLNKNWPDGKENGKGSKDK